MKGFTMRKVFVSKDGTNPMIISKPYHYTYSDEDMVYYNDTDKTNAYAEIPTNGKRTYSLKIGYNARMLVKADC